MSHSLHLSAIINEDTTLFKEEMNHYLETKLSELVSIVKTNVEETIDNKIQSIYKKASSVSYDDVLFNLDGTQNLSDCVEALKQQYNFEKQQFTTSSKQYFINKKRTINNLSAIKDKRCFAFKRGDYNRDKHIYYFYKYVIIHQKIQNGTNAFGSPIPNTFETISHTLSNDILFAIKYLQIGFNNSILNLSDFSTVAETFCGSITTQLKILDEHPEYFQQQCNEFELFCKKEYEEINKTKEQLKATISLYEDKLSKYTNFEEDKQTLEDELTFYRLDKHRLEHEKKELETMKLTLNNEYHELELEKMELEKEKLRLKEDTMKLQMEQRKLTKTQTSLATIQLSIDDASKALDKEINDLTYAKFIFEREKEEFARTTTM
jgi:hypothetical protein